jgi:hypothetical protein
MQKKANAQIGTFGFCRPTSQTQKTKRAFFGQRSDELTRKQTNNILKYEIIGNFGLFWLNNLIGHEPN